MAHRKMHDFVTPPDLPEAGRSPIKNRQKEKRARSTRIVWLLSGILGAIALLIVVIVVAAPILGLTGNIAVGQARSPSISGTHSLEVLSTSTIGQFPGSRNRSTPVEK